MIFKDLATNHDTITRKKLGEQRKSMWQEEFSKQTTIETYYISLHSVALEIVTKRERIKAKKLNIQTQKERKEINQKNQRFQSPASSDNSIQYLYTIIKRVLMYAV